MKSQGFSDQIKQSIKERANGRCEICGMAAPHAQYHHRRPRGMGGSRKMDTNQCANGMYLHPHCHGIVEMNRKTSLMNGWLVPQHKEPIDQPVKRFDGWWHLTHDGKLIPADIEETDPPRYLV
jgi:hypothetical protein